jgi:hypothetical protein
MMTGQQPPSVWPPPGLAVPPHLGPCSHRSLHLFCWELIDRIREVSQPQMPILIPLGGGEALTRHTRPVLRRALHLNSVRTVWKPTAAGAWLLLLLLLGFATLSSLAVRNICCCFSCQSEPRLHFRSFPELMAALHKQRHQVAQGQAAMIRRLPHIVNDSHIRIKKDTNSNPVSLHLAAYEAQGRLGCRLYPLLN